MSVKVNLFLTSLEDFSGVLEGGMPPWTSEPTVKKVNFLVLYPLEKIFFQTRKFKIFFHLKNVKKIIFTMLWGGEVKLSPLGIFFWGHHCCPPLEYITGSYTLA